jgi:hypothetical protein
MDTRADGDGMRPQTISEKILSAKSGGAPVYAGDIVLA